jgi:hypothetical protein
MGDEWAEPFDPCSPYSYEAMRWQRYAHEPPLVSGRVLAIALAAVALIGFAATDLSLAENLSGSVQVTGVYWYAGGEQIGTSAGFTIHTSQQFNVAFRCTGLCYRYDEVSVGSPFSLVGTQFYYYPSEYVNVTAQAPSTGYSGPLSITLTIG